MRFLILVLLAGSAFALEPGKLPQAFRASGPNCVDVPDWQVHAYNEDFYILRESGCTNYEKPFLYLIFGNDFALLEDTGAGNAQTAPQVFGLIEKWAKLKKRATVPLIVIHSHGHGDHTSGDKQFQGLPNVKFIPATPTAIAELGPEIELGGRVLDVLPIPGHNNVSIALYDRKTGILLTGDSLYPGRLYVPIADFPTFAASAAKLAAFVKTHPITHVLGTHIEQSDTPYVDYPTGTVHQPSEHSLALTRAHVLELDEACRAMPATPQTTALPGFTIVVRPARPPR